MHSHTTVMELNLIVAIDSSGGIGLCGDIPWKNTAYGKKDMAYFKKITAGCAVIMGRKTYESIPTKFRPLPGRINIVLSKSYPAADVREPDPARAVELNSLDAAVEFLRGNHIPRAFVCGGAGLYIEALARSDLARAYVTVVPYDGPTDVKIPLHFPSHVESIVTATEADQNAYIIYRYNDTAKSALDPGVRVRFGADDV
jgi:dihydrofolate reductase